MMLTAAHQNREPDRCKNPDDVGGSMRPAPMTGQSPLGAGLLIVHLPVGYAESADRIVDLVERGVLRVQPHWSSREACQSFIDRLPGASGERNWYRPTLAIIRVAEGAGQEGMDLRAGDQPLVESCALGFTSQEVRHVA